MRILILTHNFPPLEGGISTHCYEMAKNWAKNREVWVLAPHPPHGEMDVPSFAGHVVRMPATQNRFSRLLLSIRWTFIVARKARPDLMYGTHWRNCGIPLRIVGLLTGVPFFSAVHGSEVYYLSESGRKVMPVLFRWVASGCRGFVALGEYQRQILEKLGIEADKIFTSPEGMDLARLEGVDGDAASRIRARHNLNGQRVILTVGRLVERKGHDVIIRSLPQVLSEIHEVVYLIVGRGPMEERLHSLTREMGVEQRVQFCGYVPEAELLAYYQACDVFAMPNREVGGDTEGFGIVFAEAGACCKPVIGGRSAGALEVIEDGVTGLLVNPCDVDENATALTLLLKEQALARRMGEAGRARVEQLYNYQRIAANIGGFLRKAVGKSSSEFA